MYICIGIPKGLFKASILGCGEKWDRDTDRCPICNGYLIPESMVGKQHYDSMIKLPKPPAPWW